MNYCATSDILPLIDKDKTARLLGLENVSDLTDRIITPYIAAASLEIDSVLGAFYVIPVSGTQSLLILKGIAVGLVLGMMYLPNTDGNLPERIKTRIQRSQDLLDSYGAVTVTSKTQGGTATPTKFLPDAPGNQHITTSTLNPKLNYCRGL